MKTCMYPKRNRSPLCRNRSNGHRVSCQLFNLDGSWQNSIDKKLGFSYAQLEADGALAPVIDLQVQYKNHCCMVKQQPFIHGLKNIMGSKRCMAMKFKNLMDKQRLQGQPHIFVSIKKPFRPIQFRKAFPAWHKVYEQSKKQV